MLYSVLFASVLLAQDPAATFKVDANLQTVSVQVTDRRGHGVPGLAAADFTLIEDGHPQKIAFFGSDAEPVSVTILLDSSNSMVAGRKLERVRRILGPFIRATRSQDEISLVPFTDKVGAFTTLSPAERLAPPSLRVASSGNGTALYDALATALCHLRGSKTLKQALVVITDGADQNSRLRIEQLIALARESKPEIFMIGFWGVIESAFYRSSGPKISLVSGHEIDNPVHVFTRISKETGAESFFPSSEDDLAKVLERVREIVQTQYALAYYPENARKVRKIQVRVHRSGLAVTAPRSVSAEASIDGGVHFEAASCAVSPAEHPYPWEPHVTQTPSGTTIYQEDFSDPLSGWPNRPGARYMNGSYELSRIAKFGDQQMRTVDGTIVAYGPLWRDFTASMSVTEEGSEGAGMVFRLNSTGCYTLLVTRTGKPTCSFKLIKKTWAPESTFSVETHGEKTLIPWSPAPGIAPRATIKVECKGDQIKIWLNDAPIADLKDHSFEDGYIGMAQFGYGTARFRDLSVRSLP